MSVLCGGTVSPTTVTVGDAFSITVQSTNDGFLSDTFRYNVFAMPDGDFLGEVDQGTLSSGETVTTTETFVADLDPGQYDIEVQDAVGSDVDATGICGTLTVEEVEFDPSLVEADNCFGLPNRITEGDIATVRVPVSNDNDVPAEADLLVFTPVQTIGTRRNVDIPANGSREVDVTITAPPEGSYSVDAEVSDANEGSAVGFGALARRTGLDRETAAVGAIGAGTGLVAALLSRR